MRVRRFRKEEGLQKGIYLLPNLCTTGSLFCGFYALIKSLNAEYVAAAWAIFAAGIFDLFDGRLARVTRGASQFGVEYDSLVDLASFGLAPAVLIYTWSLQGFHKIGWVASFLFFACGALRLARFNCQMDNVESHRFQGLPIPMAAYMLCATVIFYDHLYAIQPKENFLVFFLTILLGLLMVSNIPYRSLKRVHLRQRLPFVVLVGVVSAMVVFALKPPLMLWMASLAYVLSGLVEALYSKRFRRKAVSESLPPSLSVVPFNKQAEHR